MNTKRKHILILAFSLLFVSWIFMYAKPVMAATRNCNHGDTININLGDTVVVSQKGISEKVLKSSYTWIKFTAKDNGILHVSAKDYCADIRLTNSKKTPISGEGESIISDPDFLAFEMDKIDYGIKKGETYHLRLEGDPNQKNNLYFPKISYSSIMMDQMSRICYLLFFCYIRITLNEFHDLFITPFTFSYSYQ